MTRLALVALLTTVAARGVQPSEKPEDRGQRSFTKYGCYYCHGRQGQGSPSTGPRLGPNPIALPAFIHYVRMPAAEMPPYSEKVVSDAELADIRAFLAARPAPAPRKVLP